MGRIFQKKLILVKHKKTVTSVQATLNFYLAEVDFVVMGRTIVTTSGSEFVLVSISVMIHAQLTTSSRDNKHSYFSIKLV